MKIAEALSLRAGLQHDLAWLKDQFIKIVRVQEGTQPAEQPEVMMDRLERNTREYGKLLAAINRANLECKDADGRSMTELLATRDTLRAKHSILTAAYTEATQRQERYSNNEIRWVPSVDVEKLRGKLEQTGEELRLLNLKIQELNWKVDFEDPRI